MKKFLAIAVMMAVSLFGAGAFAYDVKVDDDTYAKVGAKAQVRVESVSNDPGTDDADVYLKQGRIYFAGQVTNTVKFGLNFDFTTGSGSASDGFVMLDFSKEAKVMTGVYRVAFSRVALQDSYQYILPDGPAADRTVAPLATGLATYRSAGITLWGDVMDGRLRYNVGVWDDVNQPIAGLGDGRNEYMKSLRLVYNFADPEKGYTCPGCYLGKGNIMNVGFGYLTADYGTLTYTAMTLDAFYEAGGTTLEAAYFTSDRDTAPAVGAERSSFYVAAAKLFGNWQPAARYESYDSDGLAGANGDYTVLTVGANYLFSGHDAKVQLAYKQQDYDDATVADVKTLTAQLQVQF